MTSENNVPLTVNGPVITRNDRESSWGTSASETLRLFTGPGASRVELEKEGTIVGSVELMTTLSSMGSITVHPVNGGVLPDKGSPFVVSVSAAIQT
mmetsp:Transcript_20930/g.45343  ORF Transcript_20930/g.45343 Transcript_20930/m.45343 type:complete len:96 (-) Transcript_20930:616-903(-)